MLNQHLARFRKESLNLPLYLWIEHLQRPLTVRTRKALCRAEEAADQRSFAVYLAAIVAKIRAAEFGQGCLVFLITFNRQPGNFFGRGGDGTAAIVTARFAGERRNVLAEESDFLTSYCHRKTSPQSPRLTMKNLITIEL